MVEARLAAKRDSSHNWWVAILGRHLVIAVSITNDVIVMTFHDTEVNGKYSEL